MSGYAEFSHARFSAYSWVTVQLVSFGSGSHVVAECVVGSYASLCTKLSAALSVIEVVSQIRLAA